MSPVGEGKHVQVAQAAPAVAGLGGRVGPDRRESRRVGPGGDPGALFEVLLRAGAAVVERGDRVARTAYRGYSRPPRVPGPWPAGQRGPVPGPVEPVRAGRVPGVHLVSLVRI